MKKKSMIRNGIICMGLLLAVFACREKWPETVIWTDTSSLPDTLYQNPVFEPVLADPTVIQTGDGTFYAYGTEDTWDKDTHHIVAIIKSKDLVKWTYVSDAFTATSKPSWGTANAGVWAPQITQSQKDGRYYLYYSLSTWGDPNPGIGVAVADSPEGPFTDLGQILRSNEIGVANSIDPFFTSIKKGSRYTYYLFWGSFNGIYCIQMQDETTIYPGAKPTMIANNLYEASYIYQHDGKFYFFGSMGSCCEGRDSQYRVKVAKADNILGPYLNDLGQDIKTNGVEGKAFLTGAPDLWFNTNDQTKSEANGESERLNVLFINDGTGMFTEFNLGSGIGTAAATGLKFYKSNGTASWGDIDGDGYLDMLHNGDGKLGTGENNDQVWRLYKNGNGQSISMAFDFGMQQLGRQNSINNGSYIVDWDGDGVMDLITSGWSDGWGSIQRLDLWKGDSDNPMGGFTATTFGSGVPGFYEQGMRIADLDGDGKPDLLINGYSNTGEGRKVGWIRNTSSKAAEIPGAPQNLGIYQEDGYVELSWEVPAGWNGKPGVTYNLSLYNKTTGKWMYNPMSDENGKRKVAGRMGNVFTNKVYYLYDLPAGEYEWTVQAINGQYMGGEFAEKQTFTVGTSALGSVNANLQPRFFVSDRNLTVKAQAGDCNLKVYSISGALIKSLAFAGTITVELPEIGVYIAEVVNAQGIPYRSKVVIR